jgi:hypothetical protein
MLRLESKPLTAWSVAWDVWRVSRGPAAIAARQQARLQALIEHARGASRFYAEHYRTVPPALSVRRSCTSCPRSSSRS